MNLEIKPYFVLHFYQSLEDATSNKTAQNTERNIGESRRPFERRFWYEQDSDSRLASKLGEDHPSAQILGAPFLFVQSLPMLAATSGGAGVLH